MINISKLYCGLAGESDHLRYSAPQSYGPVVVYNSTRRCNLRCVHCYSYSDDYTCENELDTSQAKKLLSDVAEANCPVILFSGGEPLLRGDLFELLNHAKHLGLRTVISTNGTLIDTEAAEKLAQTGLGYAGISLDGNEAVHDKFRAVTGSFKQTLQGIENCKKVGLKAGLRFTITRQNADQVGNIFDVALETGVRRICFYHLICTGRASSISEQALPPQQTRGILDLIIERTAELVEKEMLDEVLTVGNHADGPYLLSKMAAQSSQRFETAKKLLLANGGNKIGQNIACVSWDGSVYPDQFWRNYSLGNVTENSFKQIWQNPDEPVLKKLRNKSEFADKRCLGCKWFNLCKGNYRFLESDPDDKNWLNEPACYLTDDEIA